jgi:hypothetical protein
MSNYRGDLMGNSKYPTTWMCEFLVLQRLLNKAQPLFIPGSQ